MAASETRAGPTPSAMRPSASGTPRHVHLRRRPDELCQLRRPAAGPPLVPPDPDVRDRVCVEPEHGHAAHALGPSASSGHAQHRARRASVSDELVEALEWRCSEDTNEVLEVLADDDVVRHLERRLLAISTDERRAIPLREQCDGEGDGQERDRRHSGARPAGQPDRGEPRRQRFGGRAPTTSGRGRKDPRDCERSRDRDEAREQEKQKRRPLPACKLLLVGCSAYERHRDDEQRRDGNDVERADSRALALRKRHRDPDEHGCDDGRRDREPHSDRRQDALAKNVQRGRSGEPGDEAAHGDPREPAENDADERHGAALEAAQQSSAATSEPRTT